MLSIDQKYAGLDGEAGILGKPTSVEAVCPDKVGSYRHYENGSIYWHPDIGAYEVHGYIHQKWGKLGWEKSILGYPVSDESASMLTTQRPAGGRYNLFQNGAILYKNGAMEAFEVHGPILDKYCEHKSEKGVLGFPMTDELNVGGKDKGRFQRFENGSIYWTKNTGAHEIHGMIHDCVVKKNGGLRYGYPLTDVLTTDRGNQYCDFYNQVVYWKKGTPAAVLLDPEPFLHWSDLGLYDDWTWILFDILYKGTNGYCREMYGTVEAGSAYDHLSCLHFDELCKESETGVFWGPARFFLALHSADGAFFLEFTVKIHYNRQSHLIQTILHNWKPCLEKPWLHTNDVKILPYLAQIWMARFGPILKPHIGKPFSEIKIPASFHVLAMKHSYNGFDFYIEPVEHKVPVKPPSE